MPLFVNRERLVATNLKVAYTSLCSVKTFRRMSRAEFALRAMTGILPATLIVLVRNPYERLVSFYVQKMKVRPLQCRESSFYWERCQLQLAPFLGVDVYRPKNEVAEKLLEIKFDEFVEAIDAFVRASSVSRLDAHLRPQAILLQRLRIASPRARWSLVRIEDQDHLQGAVGARLPKMNATSKGPLREYFDARTIALTNSIYSADFRELPYERW